MKTQYDQEIHLTDDGRIDIDYYVLEARRLRNEEIVRLFSGAGHWLRQHFGRKRGLPLHAAFNK